ncbi:MAG: stage IV sporulation protein A [Lachnospiraceae bacterium]|nr:stage IV sporulation protein A [Lachnospiraceae bacterium]
MENYHVYKDISTRTGGDIYIGVVGPVRTGKSTFIKRFMDLLVIPTMEDVNAKERTKDELPQSASGKTIMTTEPKFIPKEAAHIRLAEGIEANIRLIDCVGYMVEGAAGHEENNEERLVKTPWYDYDIPFTQAAEIGTRKVIHDHSTIGIVVTTDASFGDIPRANYLAAEEKTVEELKKLGKPFLVLLNSERPYSEDTQGLAASLTAKYGVRVLPVNCEQLKKEDILRIMEQVLLEFPVTRLDFGIPKWMEVLPNSHWLKAKVIELARTILQSVTYIKDAMAETLLPENEYLKQVRAGNVDLATGKVQVKMEMDSKYYYQILSDTTGVTITSEYQMMQTIAEMAKMKTEYEKVKNALEAVKYKGFGFVSPTRSEIHLDEPEVVKHGNRYGVKMKAEAPSITMIKAYIETEIAPIVGSEQQAQDLIDYMKEQSDAEEDGIWSASIFGKSIEQIVEDGVQAKISQVTDDCQSKLQDTMQKIVNDSNGGMICIII